MATQPPADPTPEEFVLLAARAGLTADARYVASIKSAVEAAIATYHTIRSLDVTGHEPANAFRPVKRPGAN